MVQQPIQHRGCQGGIAGKRVAHWLNGRFEVRIIAPFS